MGSTAGRQLAGIIWMRRHRGFYRVLPFGSINFAAEKNRESRFLRGCFPYSIVADSKEKQNEKSYNFSYYPGLQC